MIKKDKKKSKSPTSRTESRKKPVNKKSTPRKKTKEKKIISLFKRLPLWCKTFVILSLLGFIFCLYILFTLPDIDSQKAIYRRPKIVLLSEDNQEIGVFGDKYNEPATYEELPKHLIDALILTEDKRFFSHFGFDPIAITRAIVINIQTGRKASGASTITQQLAKNLFLSSEKTYMRKIREFFLAILLDFKFTKEQILTLYFNRAYFGSGNYGISSAADYYYGKKVKDLNLYEATSLIASLKSPLGYNPVINPDKSQKRTFILLENMQTAGVISNNPIEYTPPVQRLQKYASYFNDWVLGQATDILGEINQDVYITTTLNGHAQKVTEQRASKVGKDLQVAVIVNDYNGAIRAMAGGKNYKESQFNRATQAKRQQGSLLKPFLYLLGMENNFPLHREFFDEPLSYGNWSVNNYSNSHYGWITLEDALIMSLNTVPVSVATDIGIKKFQDYLAKFGVDATCTNSGAIALGVCESTLIETTSAYTSIAAGGYAIYPYGITRIEDKDGNPLYKRQTRDKSAIVHRHYIEDIQKVMGLIVARGTGQNAYVRGMDVKGKTGTTQNYRDALFIGFDRGTVIGVWVGKDDNSPMNNITGGGLPAIIFKDIMEDL